MYNSCKKTKVHSDIEKKTGMKRHKTHAKFNIFIMLLVVFVAVAAMQALELSVMLSEAKSIGNDVDDLRTNNIVLLEQHRLYSDRLPRYLRI